MLTSHSRIPVVHDRYKKVFGASFLLSLDSVLTEGLANKRSSTRVMSGNYDDAASASCIKHGLVNLEKHALSAMVLYGMRLETFGLKVDRILNRTCRNTR